MKPRVVFIIFLSFLKLLFCANPAIVENDLGKNAIACASRFCHSKDSLNLWLALEWKCFGETSSYTGTVEGDVDHISTIVQAPSRRRKLNSLHTHRRLDQFDITSLLKASKVNSLSSAWTGIICTFFSALGIFVGIIIGRAKVLSSANPKFAYSSIPDVDSDLPIAVLHDMESEKSALLTRMS